MRRITAAQVTAWFGKIFANRRCQKARLVSVGRADQEMLELVLAPDPEGYYAQVMRDHDARRICGLTPIYLLTALMQAEKRTGQLLRYTQWVDADLSSSVTFASAVFA